MNPKVKLILAAAVFSTLAFLAWRFGDALSLTALADRETEIRRFGGEHPVLVYAVAFAIYVGVTGLSLPGAAVLTLAIGWYFGLLSGVILVSFASTAGATIAFLLSRYLLRDGIQSKFGERLKTFNENLEREGAFYLFTLRLIPAVPFFVVNLVMGLTPMKARTFWWVSQIGMLPGTIAYVYAGSTFPTLRDVADNGVGGILTLPLILAFVVLAFLPRLIQFGLKKFRGVRPGRTAEPEAS